MTQEYKVGDKGPYIAKIQRMLNEKAGLHLKPDGDFGPMSRTAISAFQEKNGMRVTGTYSVQMANYFDPLIEKKYLKEADFDAAAKVLNVPKSSIKGVQQVESKGAGFLDDGRPIILFERHQFRKRMVTWMSLSINNVISVMKSAGIVLSNGVSAANADVALIKKYPDIYNPDAGGYLGYEKEYDRLNKASILNEAVALQSASWGLFQIMGYWYGNLGYPSVAAMVQDAKASEGLQLDQFCKFIKEDARLWRAMSTKDWHTFAVAYNGPAQQGYDTRIATAVRYFELHPEA